VGKGKKRFESSREPTEESSQHEVPQDTWPRLQYTNRGPSSSNRTSETSSLADSVPLEVSDSNYNSMLMSDLNDALNIQGLKEVGHSKRTLYRFFKFLCLAIFIIVLSYLLANNFLSKLWLFVIGILEKLGLRRRESFIKRCYGIAVNVLKSVF